MHCFRGILLRCKHRERNLRVVDTCGGTRQSLPLKTAIITSVDYLEHTILFKISTFAEFLIASLPNPFMEGDCHAQF